MANLNDLSSRYKHANANSNTLEAKNLNILI